MYIRGPSWLNSVIRDYRVVASNSMEAAALALDLHVQAVAGLDVADSGLELTDDSVITVGCKRL
jgi:hypothetical protein